MKNYMRISVLIIALLLLACSGCGQTTKDENINSEDIQSSGLDEDVIDLSAEIVPLTETPARFSIPVPTASGISVKKNEKAVIDYSNAKDGYVMVKYLKSTTNGLYVQIAGPSGTTYQYTLKPNGSYEVYPLSDGNGSYKISVLERIEGNKAAVTASVKTDVKLVDEFAPFIRPNQYVNYNKNSTVVRKATELMQKEKNIIGRITVVYNYVVQNIKYDKDMAAKIKNGSISVYYPNVDSVLKNGKGICFDYAALMTAMLRSQGIPCKLVVGYAGDIYHAWISAYSDETGWIDGVIYFDGISWKLMDPTFASSGGQSDEVMKYIGNGANYKIKYLY